MSGLKRRWTSDDAVIPRSKRPLVAPPTYEHTFEQRSSNQDGYIGGSSDIDGMSEEEDTSMFTDDEPMNNESSATHIRATWLNCLHSQRNGCKFTPCCACSDKRPTRKGGYPMYVDGEGDVIQGARWQYYCPSCKDDWSWREAYRGHLLTNCKGTKNNEYLTVQATFEQAHYDIHVRASLDLTVDRLKHMVAKQLEVPKSIVVLMREGGSVLWPNTLAFENMFLNDKIGPIKCIISDDRQYQEADIQEEEDEDCEMEMD